MRELLTEQAWAFDWTSFWTLTLVVLLDGVRRVPEGSYLVRCLPGYGWSVGDGPSESSRWRIASWWSPLSIHCVVHSGATEPADPVITDELFAWFRVLRVVGGATLVSLLVGVPTLSATFGAWGFLFALGLILVSSASAVLCATLALRWLGYRTGAAFRSSAQLLWPFTAPRAPELFIERALATMQPARAIQLLLPPGAFRNWARPLVYDSAIGQDGEPPAAAGISIEVRREILSVPPEGYSTGERFCPRCGKSYVRTVEKCRDCNHLSLIEPGEPLTTFGPDSASPGAAEDLLPDRLTELSI